VTFSHSVRGPMVIYCQVDLGDLRQQGKDYPWPKPLQCPSCEGERLWGHGYVLRYFDRYSDPLWVKRYRCPHCGAVHTLRPGIHYRRFQAAALVVFLSLLGHILQGSWLKSLSRQRQQYWWKGFKIQAFQLGMLNEDGSFALTELSGRGIILSTHSVKYCEIKPVTVAPYLTFAVTPPVRLL
jgi:hypothetical protein